MTPRTFILTGGRQRKGALQKREWHRHEKGIVLEVDVTTRSVTTRVEYESPLDARPADDPAILFKSGTIADGKLYVPTQTEVLVYELGSFARVGYLSLPMFNDVHHVLPTSRGTLLVAVTGLDLIVETSLEGELLWERSVIGEDTWSRFSRDTDYRKVLTTKPHRAHPNFVFELDDAVWATRFEQKDAVCLTAEAKPLSVGVERPHDGVVHGTAVWFTTVNGHVVQVPRDGSPARDWDLNRIVGARKALGWCRGLHVIDERRVVVGFSRLRPSKIRENLHWVAHQFGAAHTAGALPSRIALFDLERGTMDWEINVEDHGMNVLFSILPVSED